MTKQYMASFHFIENGEVTSQEISVTPHFDDLANTKEVAGLSKSQFLENYCQIINQGECALVMNPKIPDSIRRIIQAKIQDKYADLSTGHILCSSGTTSKEGIPKSFYFPIQKAIGNATAHSDSLAIDKESKVLFPLPLSHSFGVVVGIWGSLVRNTQTYIFDQDFSVSDLFDALTRFEINILYLTPSLARQMIKFSKRTKKPIHCPNKISIGSSILFYEDVFALRKIFPGAELFYTYGLTEMGPRVSTFKIEEIDNKSGLIPIGYALTGVEITGEDELKVSSIYCAKEFENSLYATQDEIEQTEMGPLIKGRKDDTIIYQGINIYPAEIEVIVQDMEDVDEVALIGADSKLHGQVPVLVVKGQMSQESIFDCLKNHLPESHLPKKIIFIDEFPKTSLGKIQREVLKSNLQL